MIKRRKKVTLLFRYLTIQGSWYTMLVRWDMNTQFKKGVLELIVLLSISKKDKYGYELILEVCKVVDVNDGTIYPLLKRLTNEGYFETYLVESTEGPPRKYYKITVLGKKRLEELIDSWTTFATAVGTFIKESKKHE